MLAAALYKKGDMPLIAQDSNADLVEVDMSMSTVREKRISSSCISQNVPIQERYTSFFEVMKFFQMFAQLPNCCQA